MSKNTAVKVQGEAQTQNGAAKYSTNLIGEGSCTWVPEDEADSYAQTTTLSASENGTYGPEEGYAGFDRVTVNVDKKLTTGNAAENGTYNASENEMNGYSEFTVNVHSNLGPLYVSENGTYTPQEATYNYGGENAGDGDPEGYDGYDSVHVNILKLVEPDPVTGEPEIVIEVDPEGGTGTIESCGDVAEIDPIEGLDLYIPDIDGEITPIGGVDFDPDGGIDLSSLVTDDGYITTVDSEGNVTKERYPASMKITTPPTKLQYTAGEVIDYRGIVCTLYDKAGNVYTDTRYPNGTVPMSELDYPVSTAPSPGGGTVPHQEMTPSDNPGYPEHGFQYTYGNVGMAEMTAIQSSVFQMTRYNGYLYTRWIAGATSLDVAYLHGSGSTSTRLALGNGTWKIHRNTISGWSVDEFFSSIPNSPVDPLGEAAVVEIPIWWPNWLTMPAIRQEYAMTIRTRDTFEIEVTSS